MNKPLTGITRVKQSKFLLHSQDGHLEKQSNLHQNAHQMISARLMPMKVKERNIRITTGTAVT
jgi:hypothetical protein